MLSGSKGLWTCKNGPHTVMHPAAYDVCTFAARIHLFDGHDGRAPLPGPFTWPLSLLHHWYLAALHPFYTSKVYKHFEALYRISLHWNALRCDDQGEACFEKYSGVSSAQASGERSISSTITSRRSQMCIYPFVQSRNLLEGIKPYQTSTNE